MGVVKKCVSEESSKLDFDLVFVKTKIFLDGNSISQRQIDIRIKLRTWVMKQSELIRNPGSPLPSVNPNKKNIALLFLQQ